LAAGDDVRTSTFRGPSSSSVTARGQIIHVERVDMAVEDQIVHLDMSVERPIRTVFKASTDRGPIKPRTDRGL
jgi:hypothetical protein